MTFDHGTSLAPPAGERIRWFEDTYRVKLPEAYWEALKAGNGAVPTCKTFQQGTRGRMIDRMLCLLSNPKDDPVNGWYDLTVVLSELDARLIDDEDLVGMNVIPFASLFAGDFVCFDCRANPSTPVIAVWDHECSDELQPVLETVASSFEEFDKMLA